MHVYARLDEFKAFLSGSDVGSDRDATLRTLLASSSRAVDSFCRRGTDFAVEMADIIPTAVLAGAIDDSTTAIVVNDATPFEVGQSISIDDETLLIVAIDGDSDTLTVLRGDEPAAHLDAAGVGTFRYPSEVVDATLRVAQRRWKMRDAGLTGAFGGSFEVPQTTNYDTEASILRMTLGRLRYQVVA